MTPQKSYLSIKRLDYTQTPKNWTTAAVMWRCSHIHEQIEMLGLAVLIKATRHRSLAPLDGSITLCIPKVIMVE